MAKKQTSNKKQNGRMVLSRRTMFKTLCVSAAAVTLGSGTATASSDGYGEGEYGAGKYGDPTGTLAVATGEARDIGETTATLDGSLTDLGDASSVDVAFEYRNAGDASWSATDTQTLSSAGGFSASVSELSDASESEFRAVATGSDGESTTGSTAAFTPVAPVIERFESTDRSNSAWNRFDVNWVVSHDGGELNTIVTTLRYQGSTVDAESTSVTGKDASYSHLMRVKGPVDEVVLSVNDTQNRVTTERKSV